MSHTLVNLTRTLAGTALALTLGATPALASDEAQIQRGQDVYTAQ